MQNSLFMINDEPYCLWEHDIKERNLEFLKGFDTEFFEYLLHCHINQDDDQRASLALAICLHHGLETLFSLLGAYIQAPDCVYAWIGKYRTNDLRELVSKVNSGKGVSTKLRIERVSWRHVAELVFASYGTDAKRKTDTAKLFADTWTRLSHDFLDTVKSDQYNSMKHGFRVSPGGFKFAVGLESTYGVSPPPEEMQVIGHSEYGATFFKVEKIGTDKSNRSLRTRRTSLNWSIERMTGQIQLIQMSINNIISSLMVLNGAPPGTCKFIRPVDDDAFLAPWLYNTGVGSVNFDFCVDESNTVRTTKKMILKALNK